jgi:hypothetical protein
MAWEETREEIEPEARDGARFLEIERLKTMMGEASFVIKRVPSTKLFD